MTLDAVKGAVMTYQGSASAAERRVENQPKVESQEIAAASEALANETTAIKTNQTGDNSDKKKDQEERDNFGETAQLTEQQKEQRNQQIKKAISDINKKANNSEAIFGIHEKTNRVTIKIVDKGTKEVIKEFPPEKTLDMIAKAWELAGLMVDEKR